MYEKYYKLTGKPFKLAPNPRFFYASRNHKRAMAYLLYGVKQGEGFIVVTGDVGTGKTTLVQHLLRVLKKEDVVAGQIVTTQLNANDMLRLVAGAFDIPFDRVGKATLLKNLESYFRACYQEGKRVLLVVDEAQNLSRGAIEELRMLSNFQIDGDSLLQSFLLGQKEFRITMRSDGFEQLRQRVIAAYHLSPLAPDEVKGYIEYRLRKVGWNDKPHFFDDVYAQIHSFTGGVPRRINLFCDRLLLYVYLEELHEVASKSVASVARDIREEQGGSVMYSEGNTSQPTEAQGMEAGDDGPSEALRTSNIHRDPGDEKRLEAVEGSVAELATVMREELSLLRKAMTGAHKTKEEKS